MNGLFDLFPQLTLAEKIFVWIAACCLAGAVLFILFLIISRLVKSNLERRKKGYREDIHDIVNNIILAESKDEVETWWKVRDGLKKIGSTITGKQMLIYEIISLKRSLTGVAIANLEHAYRHYKLFELSLMKLHSFKLTRKAQGIHELAEMNYVEATDQISKLLHSSRQTLRDQVFIALLKLDKEVPLSFLDDYTASVSYWMRMRIHHHLSNLSPSQLPDFSKWFTHRNIDVALFAMSMARQFRQLNTAARLIPQLHDPDKRRVSMAVTALGDMEAHEFANHILELVDTHWADAKLSRRIARSLGKMGATEAHWNALLSYLAHPEYTVRFEAASALQQAGKNDLLKAHQASLHLEALVKHVEEPLLQVS
jgi:hypothetical protein